MKRLLMIVLITLVAMPMALVLTGCSRGVNRYDLVGDWRLTRTFTHAGTPITETWNVTLDGDTLTKTRTFLGVTDTWIYTRDTIQTGGV